MKKLQLAHSELVLRQASIPDIKVVDVSSPIKNCKHPNPDPKVPQVNGNANGTNHMSVPTSPVELKSHYHPLKTQSQSSTHHTPTMAEQGKHVYHSEPANLNGLVSASRDSPDVLYFLIPEQDWRNISLLLPGMVKTETTRLCRLEFVQSCEGCMKFTWRKKTTFYSVGSSKTFAYNDKCSIVRTIVFNSHLY